MDDKQRIALVEIKTIDVNVSASALPNTLTRYQFSNHLGSASVELDDKAKRISYEEYFPYGSTSYQAVNSQTGTAKRYRYTGKERDEENALFYHGMRYYAPWLSRWMNPDPARFLDGLCLYQYCKSNPIKYFDPKGLGSDPGKHVVKKGDTYWSLAKNSGKNYSVEDLKSWNQGVDWKKLQRGSQIRTSMPQGKTSNTSTSTNPVSVKLSKDRDPDASQYQKYSFWWWAERGQYAAAFNTLDRDVQKAGAPVAEYISSYFVQLAKDVEKVATGVNPENRKHTLNIAPSIYIG